MVTYQVKVASSTAIDGTDFTLSKVGSVVIPAGAAPQTVAILVNPIDDGLFEGTETVTVEILSVTGVNVTEDPLLGEATGQILDDESGAITITKVSMQPKVAATVSS